MQTMNVTERVTAVRQKLAEWEVEAVLITSPANRRWLSGFTGSNAMLLISQDKAIIATDSRYTERAKIESPQFELFKHERTPKDDRAFFLSAGAKQIGIEKKHVTLEQAAKWRSLRTGLKWRPLAETVEPLRAIKSPAEIAIMRRAAAITDQAISQFPEIARPGLTEKQLAWELAAIMHQAGADGPAFDIIVASGPNSALPHHSASDRRLEVGDVIIVDMGAQLNGYHSDLTRSFYLGNEPSAQFWEIYNLVYQAEQQALRNIRPGMTLLTADALARDLIHQNGHKEHFGHGLGHGVGLDIHEDPFLSPRAPKKATISAGMNVTIEPGIYIPGWGGVRLEDFALVAENGLELISHAPYQPVIPV
jgi:Xaa-Pro aminopeptidase